MAYSRANSNYFDRLFNLLRGRRPEFVGSERPVAGKGRKLATSAKHHGDLEIYEVPVRDPKRARSLIEMRLYCSEVGFSIGCHKVDVVSSEDGDDQGIMIAPKKKKSHDPLAEVEYETLDPDVERIGTEVITRLFGKDEVELIVDRILSYGDCFAEMHVNLKEKHIDGLQFLPTFEMYRCERPEGLHFEQRRWATQNPPEAEFHPITIIHWRHDRDNLYGRALFEESVPDWERLRDAEDDLSNGSREAGLNPIVHTLPEQWDKKKADEYIDKHEQRVTDDIVTNYYPYGGVTIERIKGGGNSVDGLISNLVKWQTRMAVKSRIPLHMFGLGITGAKEISMQPALSHSRFINMLRRVVGTGIREAIDLELALNEIPPEKWVYQIAWPKFLTRPGEDDETGHDDTEHGQANEGQNESKENNLKVYPLPTVRTS